MGFFLDDKKDRKEEPSLFDVFFGTPGKNKSGNSHGRKSDGDGETADFADGLDAFDMLDEMDDRDIDDIDP